MINEEKLKDLFLDESNKVISIESLQDKIAEIKNLHMIYECAIKEVKTKLEILDSEFKVNSERNPIEYMQSRVKSPESIVNKLYYKSIGTSENDISNELKECADIIASTDMRMQEIQKRVEKL